MAQNHVREAEKTAVTSPPSKASDSLGKITSKSGGSPPPNPEDDPKAPRFELWPAERSFSEVLMDKTMDTVGDLLLITRRTLRELPKRSRIRAQLRKLNNKGAKNGNAPLSLKSDKPIILVLGSGWGAHSLIKVIDTEKFEVLCVSPRNHFIFTPMLPSSAVGTVEFRSLLEPIRISNPFVTYIEAECEVLDVNRKLALCTSTFAYENGRKPQFEVAYDAVVVSVGEQTATFGVPGVMEHCYFLKEINDAVGLRRRVGQCFELAALPGTLEADRKKLLRFIVVGGGPTGVEFAGTLRDFVRGDLARKYPELMDDVEVVLLQSAQSILTQFSGGLQQRALDTFRKTGVAVRTGVRVIAVTQDQVVLEGGERLEYGVCVWSTGNAARPLVQSIAGAVPAQREALQGRNPAAAKLAVDPFLRIAGVRDAIALGDCSRLSGAPLPATAQVAGQQGAYVARMINKGYKLGTGGLDQPFPARWKESSDQEELEYFSKPFAFLSLGLMAYVGSDQAITQLEAGKASFSLAGYLSFLLWRSVYITKQVSTRNRILILFDWVKTRIFGRDLSIY
ncbi:g8101 [Coccomyxa elongata]